MRLTCPNCGAQYEVADDVIPPDGRDVQCSACETIWFQSSETEAPADAPPAEPVAEPAPEQEQLQTVTEAPEVDLATVEEVIDEAYDEGNVPPPDAAATINTDPAPEPEPELPENEPPEVETPQAETPVPQHELPPEVADILRQEADRERAARAAETIETQPELGLDMAEVDKFFDDLPPEEPVDPPQAADDTVADTSIAAMMSAKAATAAAVQTRRELLPDIEEINSTLRSTSDRDIAGNNPDPEAPGRIRRKRGFRRGFWLVFLLVLIAALIYVFAPQIIENVPQAKGPLDIYVAQIDTLRVWLDDQLRAAMTLLDSIFAPTSE